MFIAAPPWYVWFDGVAGAAVLAVGGFVVKRFWLKPEKTIEVKNAVLSGSVTNSQVAAGNNITQTSVVHHHHVPDKSETELVVTQPDPDKILESLEDLPPYDVSHAREKFVGLPVLWRVAFANVAKLDKDTWQVAGSFGSAVIWFNLSSLPPVLKIANRGTPIWVRGTIKRLQFSVVIELEHDPELLKIEHEKGMDVSKPQPAAKTPPPTTLPVRKRKLDVVGKKGRIAWLNEAGNSFFEPEGGGEHKAVLAEFRNEPGDFSIITWQHVRASIVYYDANNSEVADVGRAVWLDGYNEAVDFASHVTRKLVVAIFADKWLTFDDGEAKPVPVEAKRAKIILLDDREFSLPFMLEFDLNAPSVGSLTSLTPPTNAR